MTPISPSHETKEARERAILIGAPLKQVPDREVEEHLEELTRLTDTAGVEVLGALVQRLDSPNPKYFIGEGKVKQVKEMAEEREADLIVFDEELSPAQARNLENELDIRVVDRTELILGIFARRARTAEAQMQVELAQLQYAMPRLKRMWTHLSRARGGVNMRGPGETQLETDRRLIGNRIRDLKDKLEVVARRRATQRKGRSDEFRVALVGYTNAGKSSILRALSDSEQFVEDRLFATLDPSTRAVELDGGMRALVTDTVGFIRKLPHALVASFRATLEEARDAEVLLHVLDASHPVWEEHKEVVESVLADLDLEDRPVVLVFNKADRLTHDEEKALRQRALAVYGEEVVLASAIEEGGLAELRERLRREATAQRPEVHLRLSAGDGEALATIYREGEVLGTRQEDTTIDVHARLPRAALGRLSRRAGVEIVGAA
ncbi:MAG TPA: GTPase HflX [Longimicrobiales bacterium]|nr:GTPase HflX [Longimicrobiales bacterium]